MREIFERDRRRFERKWAAITVIVEWDLRGVEVKKELNNSRATAAIVRGMIHVSFLLFFLTLGLAYGDSPFAGPAFDSAQDFPNLYLPERVRALVHKAAKRQGSLTEAEKREVEGAVAESRARVNSALGSVLRRMTVGIAENGSIRSEAIFPYLQQELGKIDPNVRILPSAGVVRQFHPSE